MNSIIKKELRENLKWAALGFVGLSAGLVYALGAGGDNANGPVTVLSPTFLMVTSYGFALLGAAIGALQIGPERRRDQWAALFHRPKSSLAIWRAKLIAGMILYALTSGAALTIAVIYAALPGRFVSPLFPAMLLPACSDLLLGVGAYFTSVVLILGPGSRFVGRLLVGVAFAGVFFAHVSFYSFWGVYGTIAGCVFLILAATCAMLRESGASTGWILRGGMVLVLLIGATVSLGFIAPKVERLIFGRPVALGVKAFVVSRSGEIAVRQYDPKLERSEYLDLDGNPLSAEASTKWQGDQIPITHFAWFGLDDEEYHKLRSQGGLRNISTYLQDVETEREGPERWFLLPEQAHYVGFDRLSKRVEARLGSDGFQPATAPVREFEPPPRPAYGFYGGLPYLFWSGSDLYAVDFLAREARVLFNSDGVAIFGAQNIHTRSDAAPLFMVALQGEFLGLNADGSVQFRKGYARDPARWPVLQVGANPALGRIYMNYSPDGFNRNARSETNSSVLQVLDSDGNEIESFTLELSEGETGVTVSQSRSGALTPLGLQLLVSAKKTLFPPVVEAWAGVPLSAGTWL